MAMRNRARSACTMIPPEGTAPAGAAFPDVPPGGPQWRLSGDLGRRYAAVSGDHNPIHLYPLTAKALGFPRQIAHAFPGPHVLVHRVVGPAGMAAVEEAQVPVRITLAVAQVAPHETVAAGHPVGVMLGALQGDPQSNAAREALRQVPIGEGLNYAVAQLLVAPDNQQINQRL